MSNTTSIKIRRRGFRGRYAPNANVRERAEERLENFVSGLVELGLEGIVLAEIRPAAYCGPGSGGDRGAWTLSLSGPGCFDLVSIESTDADILAAKQDPAADEWGV